MEFSLKTHIYGSYQKRILQSIRSEVMGMIANLDCNLLGLRTDRRGLIVIELEGRDSEFVSNVLQKEYGTIPKLDEIQPGFHTRGYLIDVGKVGYGLYVDIGITTSRQMDALIPLHRLREQLLLPEASLRSIAKKIILVDNLPVDIEILNTDFARQRIEAEFEQTFLDRLNNWIADDHERLLVLGSTLDMVENTLVRSGHREDIYQIEKLGIFEYSLRCKRSTRAFGILAAIGPRMRGIPMHLFIPSEIEAARK
ncbi:MAG: DUF2110 family protein [Candidatus Thorarchaeota archaeon]|nr:DUF2110 family protein [Candidatus Thorarchaeota archaeon]